MSMVRCTCCDRPYDSDYSLDGCPRCDGGFDADVALAESMIALPDPGRDHPFMEDKTLLEEVAS